MTRVSLQKRVASQRKAGSSVRGISKGALGVVGGIEKRRRADRLETKKAIEALVRLAHQEGGRPYKLVTLEEAAAFDGNQPLLIEPRPLVTGKRRIAIAKAVAAVIERRKLQEQNKTGVVIENAQSVADQGA